MYDLILKNIARFIQLTPDETDRFTSIIKTRTLRKRQYLVQAGDVFRYECFVNKGALRIYHIDNNGQERIVNFAFEGWWTGDMYSFLSGQPALYNVDALEDCELLMIEKNNLEQLYIDIPKFDRFFRILLQNAYIAMQRRISDGMSLSAEQRYIDFLNRYPQFEQRLTLRQIASYLGITPESLSRIRRQRMSKN
ncbi:Crp/Fnr family transcriptional regulator [Paraflavitalea sp. CAU 1676]|uniref:Crp/Fnr family transcriptional regulator n=1 Tax=Paraflavitalea sp. CAU 1676 TaxID=3032598 RepID=UPI0023DB3D14|nr:Crp/Fnr family transcriptional regulator [Paraflavitalea sp. CAU 1676]MDF2189511.1 Crp/Fnr family transcriptional regulator [Paraflavitalea sp. CAU 1676]